jgi:hypothetical protein
MACVTVMQTRYVLGFPRHEKGEQVFVLPLARALTRIYRTDAHFAAYATPNGRRLVREALDQTPITMTCAVFDIDCDDVHGTTRSVPKAWRLELQKKLRDLADAHPDPYFYETRGGARIVYELAAPEVLRSQADAKRWAQDYVIAVAYLERMFGIVADRACADWQRLYRLPHATREPHGLPEQRNAIGNAHQIGVLAVEANAADLDAARKRSKAFAGQSALDFSCDPRVGNGVLFHVLAARGLIIRAHGSNSFVIRCPNEAAHTTGHAGDGSTVLYLPAAGKQFGAIHCMHGHCVGMRGVDWLGLFSPHERRAAKSLPWRAAPVAWSGSETRSG